MASSSDEEADVFEALCQVRRHWPSALRAAVHAQDFGSAAVALSPAARAMAGRGRGRGRARRGRRGGAGQRGRPGARHRHTSRCSARRAAASRASRVWLEPAASPSAPGWRAGRPDRAAAAAGRHAARRRSLVGLQRRRRRSDVDVPLDRAVRGARRLRRGPAAAGGRRRPDVHGGRRAGDGPGRAIWARVAHTPWCVCIVQKAAGRCSVAGGGAC